MSNIIINPGFNITQMRGGFPVGTWGPWIAAGRQMGKSNISSWYYKAFLDAQLRAEQLMKIKQVGNEWHVIVEDFMEKVEWCRETLGEGGVNNRYRWHAKWLDTTHFNKNASMRNTLTLRFRDKEGIALFKLRWM